jgi:class 3 adenylate cyclase/tetratricopeptide (TPR) repeat protein
MKCPECLFDNREGAKFCKKCGNTLELKCSQCGYPYEPDSLFCDECGHDLRKPTDAPPIDRDEPQSYTPKFLAEKILTTRSSIEGERKLVTVLFADVAHSTSMAEKLDPEEVHQIFDGCFKILMDEIHKYEGTINQFLGDGLMALFGAPVAHEDHAQRACYASLSIQKAMVRYGEELRADHGIDFKIRIGLNSGHVVVGSIGDDLRMDYTAVGDTTHVASRMQTMAQPGSILVSQASYKIARDYFEFESLGKVEVKGKEAPVEVFKLIDVSDVDTRIEASVAKGLTPFVGRKNSMAALMEAYEKAKTGSGQIVGMVGEAGVGKSRLLLEFRKQLLAEDITYVEGRCLHYGGTMPYLPILDILRSYFEIEEGDREFLVKRKMEERILQLDERLKGVLPSFQDLLSLKVEDEEYLKLEPEQKREKTFEAIRDLLIQDTQKDLFIVTVEDLHWVDKTSEDFLNYLIGWLAHARVLLILLYRPEYTHHWGSKSYYNHIGLDQLTMQSSAELVQAILEDGEAEPELRELILDRAAGNPLFMEELTYTLLENGSINRKDRQYVLNRKPSDMVIPDTIQGIIAARMDRLEENLKQTMQVASVIGRDFAFRILQAITGVRKELKSHLLNLQGLEFIHEKQLFPELEYIFKHALIQEVAYNSLLVKRRNEIHNRIGEAIETLYPERLEEFYEMLAYHFSKSDALEKAYRYLRLAGEKATRNHSTWEAFRFYKGATSILDRMPATEENKRKRLDVLRLMAIPMSLLGFPDDSLEILHEGEALSRELGNGKVLARFYGGLGVYYSHKGQHTQGIEYSEKGFEESRKIEDIELMTSLAFELCTSYFGSGLFYKIVDAAQSVLHLLERTKIQHESLGKLVSTYPILCAYYGNSMGMLGNFGEGIIFCEKGLRTAPQDDLRTLGLCELQYGYLLATKGDGKPAIEHFQKCIEYVEDMKWVFISALAWTGLGLSYLSLGDPDTARKHIERGLSIQKAGGVEWWLSLHWCYLSQAHFYLGNLKDARSCVAEALKLAQTHDEKHAEGQALYWMGTILAQTDRSEGDKAENYILQGIKMSDQLRLRPLSSAGYLHLGRLYQVIGQRQKALENLKKAEGMFREMGMDRLIARAQELIGEL